ncbi:MAG: TrmH family RNA methyltransferase [Thermosynechococcaceae cyanobacterium]
MLTSLQNPLVKQMRKLQRAKYRKQQGVFLLEGTHLLQEACAVNWPLEVACCTPIWCEKYPLLWQQLQGQARIELVSADVLGAITTTNTPDGVVAIATSQTTTAPKITSLGLVLETIQDPGNLGTMIRTAAAAGAEGLLLSADTVDPEHPKVLRASAGAWFHIDIGLCENLLQAVSQYQQQGFQILATRPDAEQSYWKCDLQQPTLILIGNEGAGLSAALSDLAHTQVKIPTAPAIESLNAGVSAALLLYEAQRQRS